MASPKPPVSRARYRSEQSPDPLPPEHAILPGTPERPDYHWASLFCVSIAHIHKMIRLHKLAYRRIGNVVFVDPAAFLTAFPINQPTRHTAKSRKSK